MNYRVASPLLFILAASCVSHRKEFVVVPGEPSYALVSPLRKSSPVPFPGTLKAYNGFEPGNDWFDVHPLMELRIENAYYEPGASRRGLAGFLGTEIARYRMASRGGLRLLATTSMKNRPAGDLPVQQLISSPQEHQAYYRYFFQVVFHRSTQTQGSVLLGARSLAEIDSLTRQLKASPDVVCAAHPTNCTVFPEACSVSVEMVIFVNGRSRSVTWGSMLGSVVGSSSHVEVRRLDSGRLVPVKIRPLNREALRLPLLPGDRIAF